MIHRVLFVCWRTDCAVESFDWVLVDRSLVTSVIFRCNLRNQILLYTKLQDAWLCVTTRRRRRRATQGHAAHRSRLWVIARRRRRRRPAALAPPRVETARNSELLLGSLASRHFFGKPLIAFLERKSFCFFGSSAHVTFFVDSPSRASPLFLHVA